MLSVTGCPASILDLLETEAPRRLPLTEIQGRLEGRHRPIVVARSLTRLAEDGWVIGEVGGHTLTPVDESRPLAGGRVESHDPDVIRYTLADPERVEQLWEEQDELAQHRARRQAERRFGWLQRGLCGSCGGARASSGVTLCEQCYWAERAKSRWAGRADYKRRLKEARPCHVCGERKEARKMAWDAKPGDPPSNMHQLYAMESIAAEAERLRVICMSCRAKRHNLGSHSPGERVVDGRKLCRGCGATKPVADFYSRVLSNGKLSVGYRCRACERVRGREKYLARRGEVVA